MDSAAGWLYDRPTMAEEGQQRHTAQSVRQDGQQKMQLGGFGLLGHGKARRHQRGAIPVLYSCRKRRGPTAHGRVAAAWRRTRM